MPSLAAHLARLILPQSCVLCGAPSGNALVCAGCRRELPDLAPEQACRICAASLPAGGVCGRCLRRPPAFDRTVAAFRYTYPLSSLVTAYKYGGQLPLAAFLADALAERRNEMPRPDLVLPMPLHPRRLAERGFNQAAEIARLLAPRLKRPLVLDTCRRLRHTETQTHLSSAQRRRNVRRAFACDRDLTGLAIAVVDDVLTSGATMGALATELKRRGAGEVQAWVCCRA